MQLNTSHIKNGIIEYDVIKVKSAKIDGIIKYNSIPANCLL